ncbi:MAG: SAM-dependent methyltransferase [Caulobacterales bacterium]|nr:SAM-dependent methyltransferase [Caulobacterales bacterium]
MSLRERLIRDIVEGGPISVADYMMRCLHDAEDGYYATRPRLGPGGDFITAPLVSQMFGELIGLWAVQAWLDAGAPAAFRLVEAGPGDGTLMSDLLRVARLRPDFLAAADLWLIETSEPLRREQHLRLGDGPKAPKWAAALEEVPGGAPLLLVSNELLDCLPVRQFVRTPSGWAERMVGVDAAGALAFGLAPRPELQGPANAPEGVVIERSPAQEAFGAALGARIAVDGGAALLIDYGRDAPGPGDTLQALRAHQKEDPLANPGQADLTVHADFPAVLAAARAAGSITAPILSQGEFLARLGLIQRAEALTAGAPDRADLIARQVERLVDPAQMGVLFKAVCVHSPDWPPPAFDPETA